MQKNTVITLLLSEFPEMKEYLHLLNWEKTDQGDFFAPSMKIPEDLREKIIEFQNKLNH